MAPAAPAGFDACYPQVSPQLLARVRQLWSARGLDLDAAWRATVAGQPGFRPLAPADDAASPAGSSHPVDLLLLFDQATCWLGCLEAAVATSLAAARAGARTALSPEQALGLGAILARLREEAAAVRALALAGLATPAMQIVRSLSEDVDVALAVLARPKLARRFAACRSPEEAGEFWRRHVAGGRAFRTVAEELYRVGLDHAGDSGYARWRKEVQALLGAAVHTSCLGAGAGGGRALGPATLESLRFATLRLQEMCAYARVLGRALHQDVAAAAARVAAERADGEPRAAALLGFAAEGDEVILDQMRWLLETEAAAPVS